MSTDSGQLHSPPTQTGIAVLRHATLVAALLVIGGCGDDVHLIDISSRELGIIPADAVVRGRDGGYSAQFGGRSVWCFGDTALEWPGVDGETWRTSTAASIVDLDPSEGLRAFTEIADASGVPGQLLPFTAEEAAFNQSRRPCEGECEPTWVLWPGQLVVDPHTGYGLLFYMKVFDWDDVGRGIAFWPSPDEPVTRPLVRPGEAEPTLLFTGGDPRLGNAALIVENGELGEDWLYAYSCEHRGSFRFRCELGRAPLSEVQDRTAWTFYRGGGEWSADASDAVNVLAERTLFRTNRRRASRTQYAPP